MKQVAQQNDEKRDISGVTSFSGIDHIAIAVRNLESAIGFFAEQLGFRLVRRLDIEGRKTGMLSAEMELNGIKFVLCEGKQKESQVSQLVEHYGPGVAHIALKVEDAGATYKELEDRGMVFDTNLIEGPGLRQVFSSRDKNTGLSFEFIQRTSEEGFLEENVQKLFEQLEEAGAY